MGVHSYQLDPGAVQRECDASSPDTQIEHGRRRGEAPIEPRAEVLLVWQGRTEISETRVRMQRIVADSHPTCIAQRRGLGLGMTLVDRDIHNSNTGVFSGPRLRLHDDDQM